MTKRIILYPYHLYSASAKSIQVALKAEGFKCKRVKQNGNYIPKNNDLIINWGNSHVPEWEPFETWILGEYKNHHPNFLNTPWDVQNASNKLTTFNILKKAGVCIPEYTTNWATADDWMQQDKKTIVVRHKLTSHSGNGIEIVSHEKEVQDLPEAPLYVQYVKKKAEYRVHVFKGEVIDVQQKKKRKDFQGEIDSRIRSHTKGWIFCRSDINPTEQVLEEARKACIALGLDFGAVDVIWNEHKQKAYVLEVNTAPGLEGVTITKYVNKIKEIINA